MNNIDHQIHETGILWVRESKFFTLFVQDWRLAIFKTHQFQAMDVKSCNQKTSPYALR